MNSLRGISRKIDAMLLMIIAGLILGLAVTWNYYQNRKMTVVEKQELAASLLAHRLPAEAAAVIEEAVRRNPVSDKSIKMRKVLADIYMNDLNNYEKALAELVFIQTYAPGSEIASSSEDNIRYCLNRLGRVYDAERRKILAGGENPVENNITPTSVVKFGNRHAIGIEELQMRLEANGMTGERLTKENVDAMLNSMAQEMLLSRAAERENIRRTPEFIERVRNYEKNLAINSYLMGHVFKDGAAEEEKQRQMLSEEINRLAQFESMQIDREVIDRVIFKKSDSDSEKTDQKQD